MKLVELNLIKIIAHQKVFQIQALLALYSCCIYHPTCATYQYQYQVTLENGHNIKVKKRHEHEDSHPEGFDGENSQWDWQGFPRLWPPLK